MWHPRLKEVRDRSRVGRGVYKCESCFKLCGAKEMRCDHIDSAVEFSGFRDFGTYARRLLDSVPGGIQHLCTECHDAKTAWEREQRKAIKQQAQEAS